MNQPFKKRHTEKNIEKYVKQIEKNIEKNLKINKTLQKKPTFAGIKKLQKKNSITSIQFEKLKKIFEPTKNKSGPKNKFAMNSLKYLRIKKFFEMPPIMDKEKDLSNNPQIKIKITNQPQAKQTQPKPPQTQTQTQKKTEQQQKFVYPEIEQKNPKEPLDLNIIRERNPTLMPVNMLSNLPYTDYSQAEYSQKPFYNISAYGFNSYTGTEKRHKEDRDKVILDYQIKSKVNNNKMSPHISYFAIFDGHGGDACSNFLKDNLDSFIFNSKYFPAYPIQAIKDAFLVAENTFMRKAIDQNSNVIDRSGSCACVCLIINDTLYAINLGDSRALFSSNNGQILRQITRDHKPDDPIEKNRIENAGGQVFYANTIYVDGVPEVLNESDFGEGFKFPYRINPGGMAVSFIL